MLNLAASEDLCWFATGSQHLYGDETLRQVAENSQAIARALDDAAEIPVRIVSKPVLTTPEAIRQLCLEATATPGCIGLITWMHTFSPAKMWIGGLKALQKAVLHLHTQFGRDIPWATIDMDFMNLNQSAHGDREFGFHRHADAARSKGRRRALATGSGAPARGLDLGHAPQPGRTAQSGKIARFGDNMREVAVTEGDKVEAQIRLGLLGQWIRRRSIWSQSSAPSATPISNA